MKEVTLILEAPDDSEFDQLLQNISEFVERSAKLRVTFCHIRPERPAPPGAGSPSGADIIRDMVETL